MSNRLEGYVLLINTLLPLLVGVGLVALAMSVAGSIELAWTKVCTEEQIAEPGCIPGARQHLQDLARMVEKAEWVVTEVVARTDDEIKTATADFQRMKDRLNAANVDDLTKLELKTVNPTTLKLDFDRKNPIVDVTVVGKGIFVPGINLASSEVDLGAKVRGFVKDTVLAPFGHVESAIKQLDELKPLRDDLVEAQKDVGRVAQSLLELAAPVGRAAKWVAWCALLVLAWLGFNYVHWSYQRLRRALVLIRGQA